ncbi:hypothetical protein McanMca71_001031 [Microsporum canis]|uniref:Uncharacterized protein n=1 Tax=Arthroderma otae (strain ATCC MYA-4605 / CBS 113480) TaxID=554155 RepID=C5FHS8_ARTOC|nr:uncharacterized protein MCYG_01727 [Microsporum canis CBS 113480]EEQ28908.1 predicted protein [Microsporum canis CBS 113480]
MGLPGSVSPHAIPGDHREKWYYWASSPRTTRTPTVRSFVSRIKSKISPNSTKLRKPSNGTQKQGSTVRDTPMLHRKNVEISPEDHRLGDVLSTPALSTASSSANNGDSTMVSTFSPPDRACSTAPSEERPAEQLEEGSPTNLSVVEQTSEDDVFGLPGEDCHRETEGGRESEETEEQEEAGIEAALGLDTDVCVKVEADVRTGTDASSETKESHGDDDADDEGYDDESDDEDDEEDEEEEMIPSREVDFLLENAEQNRLNDLAALQDEFDDEIQYIAHERNTLLSEKMFWQTKFVTAIKGREKQRSRASSLTEDNSRLEAINKTLQREMGLIQDIIDNQYKEVKVIKSNCLDAVTELTQACEVTKSYLDKAKEENMKTAKELAILRKIVMKIRQPSKKLTEFSMHHDFQQALEVNQELKEKVETQHQELNQLHAQLAERDAKLKKLQVDNAKLEGQLDDMESFNAKYSSKLDDTRLSLAYYQKSLLQARDKESHLNDRLSIALNEWSASKLKFKNELIECRAKLQLKDSMINALHRQSSVYLENWKDTIGMLSDRSQGDELSVKLADCLQETLDRNEALEIELGDLREKTIALLNQNLG